MLRLSLLLWLIPACLPPAATLSAGEIYSAAVVKISGGDAITVMPDNGRKVKIRLYGIAAPEKRQHFGRVARDHLRQVLRGREVAIEPLHTDQDGHTVALVWLGTARLVNEIMVTDGLAWHWPEHCQRQPLCRRLQGREQVARQEKRGLWKGKQPVPPWEWKK